MQTVSYLPHFISLVVVCGIVRNFCSSNGVVNQVVALLNPSWENPNLLGVVRWPGGCYVSAYHWKDGVGPERQPAYDKAWRVEESNRFGTDEFMNFCDKIGAEPYICTNAELERPRK